MKAVVGAFNKEKVLCKLRECSMTALLLSDQHHRAAQPADRHDEPQLPAHLRQLGRSILQPQ